ncbi:MAG: hypothetical protein ACOCQY_02900 [Halorhabdus sp.]
MNRTTLLVIATVAATAILVPTGAIPFDLTGNDEVSDAAIELSPSDGPNGKYALLDEDDELELVMSSENPALDGEGVPADAVVPLDQVFTITYTGDQYAEVWISDDADDVRFYRSETPERSMEGRSKNVTLGPDQTVAVGLLIDTRGEHDVADAGSFNVEARIAEPETATPTEPTTTEPSPPPAGPGPGGGGGEPPAEPGTPTRTETTTVPTTVTTPEETVTTTEPTPGETETTTVTTPEETVTTTEPTPNETTTTTVSTTQPTPNGTDTTSEPTTTEASPTRTVTTTPGPPSGTGPTTTAPGTTPPASPGDADGVIEFGGLTVTSGAIAALALLGTALGIVLARRRLR